MSWMILVVIGGVTMIGLLALVLGIVALARINRSGGALKGRGLAIAAIVLGALMLLAPCIFAPLLWWAKPSVEAPPPPPSETAPAEPEGTP
jgi:hypothetical protein